MTTVHLSLGKNKEHSMDRLRNIPKLDLILKDDRFLNLNRKYGEKLVKLCTKEGLESMRSAILAGGEGEYISIDLDTICFFTERCIEERSRSSLMNVINATGVVLHTNLGRSLLSEKAAEAVARVARNYVSLEFDMESGNRGHRDEAAAAVIRELTGAEDAAVVNNNAAAVLIVLAAISKDSEVLVSRGELVEIGGSFRIPDVMELSGGRLKEVGTTNRTRLSDYERSISENTGLLLKVHTSNYRIVGFHSETSVSELSNLSKRTGIPLYVDLGSGSLMETRDFTSEHEDTVQEVLRSGADIISFSGDKLLGGPQAGIIAGRRDLVEKVRNHPLMRALRPDKMTLAALEATLKSWLLEDGESIPVKHILTRDKALIRIECDMMCSRLQQMGFEASVREVSSASGGGTLPTSYIPSYGVHVKAKAGSGLSAEDLKTLLRLGEDPVIARVTKDEVVLDLRTVREWEQNVIESKFSLIAKGWW